MLAVLALIICALVAVGSMQLGKYLDRQVSNFVSELDEVPSVIIPVTDEHEEYLGIEAHGTASVMPSME